MTAESDGGGPGSPGDPGPPLTSPACPRAGPGPRTSWRASATVGRMADECFRHPRLAAARRPRPRPRRPRRVHAHGRGVPARGGCWTSAVEQACSPCCCRPRRGGRRRRPRPSLHRGGPGQGEWRPGALIEGDATSLPALRGGPGDHDGERRPGDHRHAAVAQDAEGRLRSPCAPADASCSRRGTRTGVPGRSGTCSGPTGSRRSPAWARSRAGAGWWR